MAKGKHAASAAIRRAEAAHEHIDRLTDQLVEAKARARRHEAAAIRIEPMEKEIRRLRSQVEAQTSDELEKVNTALDGERSAGRARIEMLLRVIKDVLDRANACRIGEAEPEFGLTADQWIALRDVAGGTRFDEVFGPGKSRSTRRAMANASKRFVGMTLRNAEHDMLLNEWANRADRGARPS